MKITSFTIKSYRSIAKIENFELYDPTIVCLIGKNGSGKSNILYAIASLQDNAFITDSDYNVNSSSDEIEISVHIQFDELDKSILEKYELSLQAIEGFRVTKKIKRGNDKPSRYLEPIGYKTEDNLTSCVEELKKDLEASSIDNDNKLAIFELLKSISLESPDESSISLVGVRKKLTELGLDAQFEEKISRIEAELNNLITAKIAGIFDNELNISLLSLNEYKIEDSAPFDELADRNTHKFVYDLIALSDEDINTLRTATGHENVNLFDSASTKISDELKKVWPAHELNVVIRKDSGDANISVCFRTPQDKAVGIEKMSDGEKWFLGFYTQLANAKRNKKSTIWLFDEPGKDLHFESQNDMKDFFEDHSNSNQIIYTTHQPFISQWHKLERIFAVENLKEKGTYIHERFWKDEEAESPVKDLLSLFIGEDMLSGKQHIIAEGLTENFFINGWIQYFEKFGSDEQKQVSVASKKRVVTPTQGVSSIPLYVLFLAKKTKNKKYIDWVVLTDSKDDLQESVIERLKDVFPEEILNAKCVSIEGLFAGQKKRKIIDIEDVFLPKDYLTEVKDYYAKKWPSIVFPELTNDELTDGKIVKSLDQHLKDVNPNFPGIDKPGIAAHIYKKLINNKNTLSAETVRNFGKLLKTVNESFINGTTP